MRSTPSSPVKSAFSKISGASSWPLSSSSAQRVVVAPMSAIRSTCTLGVQVRDPGAFELSDHVLEHQLAFFGTLQHQLIHVGIGHEPGDDLIQVSMLYPQLLQPLHVPENLSVYFVVHDCSESVPTSPAAGRQKRGSEDSTGRLWSCTAAAGRLRRSYARPHFRG